MGFKVRKKLIAIKRECSARVGRSKAGDDGGVVCVIGGHVSRANSMRKCYGGSGDNLIITKFSQTVPNQF